jgi:hypothetical protein
MNIPRLDLISFFDTMYGTAKHGRMYQIEYFITSGRSGYDVELILRQYGIRVWGRQRTDITRSLLVKQSQAAWAEYVLCRAGVPVAGELIDPRNARYAENHPDVSMPKPWKEKGVGPISFVDHLVDLLAKLAR